MWALDTTVTAPTVGRLIAASEAISPGRVRPQLQRERLVLRPQAQQGQRQAPLVVEAALRLEHRAERAQHRGHHLLGRGLAVGARHRRHRHREARPVIRGQPSERARGVVHQDRRHRGRQIVRQVVDDQARRATRGRVAQEAVAVAIRPLDGEEGLPDAQVAAVDADAGDGHTEVARHEGALGSADHVLDAQRPPRPSSGCPTRPQRGPRHLAVVEIERLGADDLVGLVPLPRDHHHVARAPPGHRGLDGPAAIGHGLVPARGPGRDAGLDLGQDRLGPLGARVVGGHPGEVAEPRRDAAHDRALAAVAVAAAAEDHAEAPARAHQLTRGGEHALQRVGRMRVVHHHQEGLARLHPLEPAGHRRHPGERLADPSRAPCPAQVRRRWPPGDSSRCARRPAARRSRSAPRTSPPPAGCRPCRIPSGAAAARPARADRR